MSHMTHIRRLTDPHATAISYHFSELCEVLRNRYVMSNDSPRDILRYIHMIHTK